MIVLLVLIMLIFINLILKEDKYKKIGVLISFFLIFSIFAFRNQVGVDDLNYITYYNLIFEGEVKQFFSISGVENSFYYIAILLSKFGFNYKMLFIVYAFISCFFLYKITEKMEFNKKEYLLFFLSFLTFSILPYITIMRQFAAAMIGIYASLLFNDNKYIKSILLLLLAVFFHNSSIIFIFVFIFSKIKLLNKKAIYIFLPILSWFLNITGIFYYLMKIVLVKTPYYNYFLSIGEDSFGGTSKVVLLMFIVYCFSIYLIKNKILENKKTRIILVLEMIFFSLYFITQNMGVLGRLYDYFIIFEPFSLIWVYICAKPKFKNLFFGLISLFFLFLIVYNFGINNFERFHINNYSINIVGGIRE